MASNTAMLTLDSLSLLLSKQNPSQATHTLSKQLREIAGIGTLGADRLQDPLITEAKGKDQTTVALGWTLMEINKTRDSAEAASSFLQKEIEAESKYWEDVVGVQSSGWSVCKIPQERHTLGVRFGFSECKLPLSISLPFPLTLVAAPEFKNNGLAPMRRGEDGTVQLDCGRLGGVSERLVVTYEREGKVVGRSALPSHTEEDAPLEDRVLEARNTLFAQELWYELGREARTLATYDVRPQTSSLVCDLDEKSRITIELATLDEFPSSDPGLPENDVAETVSLALHMLLSNSHRQNELMRIRPLPPYMPRSRNQQQVYYLLRPIIARSICLRNISSSTTYIGALVQALQKAGLGSSFTIQTAQPPTPDPASLGPNQLSAGHLLIRNLIQPTEFSISLTLLPDITFTIRGRTYFLPVTATYYYISLPPSSPIETIHPPHKDGYSDLSSLTEYLRSLTSRLLTQHCLKTTGEEWSQNIQGTSLAHAKQENFGLRFEVEDKNGTPALKILRSELAQGKPELKLWKYGRGEDSQSPSLKELLDKLIEQVSAVYKGSK